MKLAKYFGMFSLALFTANISAEEIVDKNNSVSVFHFSTQVSRAVEKDLMQAEIFSRKAGKNLVDLKKGVSSDLNEVLDNAKKYNDIDIIAEGITNYADYDNKGKVSGWVAEGRIILKGKNFDNIAKVLDELGENVAIANVNFSVSPEKMASLEDEMTLEIIEQFQHKATVIQKGLNTKKYVLSDIQLQTPNGEDYHQPRMYVAASKVAFAENKDNLPLQVDKEMISATASGKVIFE